MELVLKYDNLIEEFFKDTYLCTFCELREDCVGLLLDDFVWANLVFILTCFV